MDNSQYEKEYKQQVTEFFNQRTKYDDDFRFRLALALVDLVQLEKGQKILDVATGTGIHQFNIQQPALHLSSNEKYLTSTLATNIFVMLSSTGIHFRSITMACFSNL
ncbi:MAG: hypothetical protein WBA41_26665 [Rivularia sp. (in: cyanobacteria)]